MRLIVKLGFSLLFVMVKSSDPDYLPHDIQPCAFIEFVQPSNKFVSSEGLQLKTTITSSADTARVPPGFTFFTEALYSTKLEYRLKVEANCDAKHCHDGPFQQNCRSIIEGDIVEFQNTSNETLVCTCDKNLSGVLKEKIFDSKYTGIVFSPNVKNWEGKTVTGLNTTRTLPATNTMENLQNLISILSTKFQKFSTYGAQPEPISRSQNAENALELIPMATAQVNQHLKAKGLPTLAIMQGIYQTANIGLTSEDVSNAFVAAEAANTAFPGTVCGLIFTSNYVTNYKSAVEVCSVIDQNKERSEQLGLRIGIRLNTCTNIVSTKLYGPEHQYPQSDNFNLQKSSQLELIYTTLLKRVSFVVCAIPPLDYTMDSIMQVAVDNYGKIILKTRDILKTLNPNLTMVAEVGMPSSDKSQSGTTNNVNNLVHFWNEMSAWASKNQFPIDLYEAFDEPLRSENISFSNSGLPQGRYGWWDRYENTEGRFCTYVPKVEELTSEDVLPETAETNGRSFNVLTILLFVVILTILGVSGAMLWRMRRIYGIKISKEAREAAEEFRNGTLSSSSGDTLMSNISMDSDNSDGKKVDETSFIFALRFPYDKKYELDKKSFSIDENCILGQGHYGIVYKGKINGMDTDVAFKTLKSTGSIMELKTLLSEIKIMAYVGKHDNVVSLLGAYTAKIEHGVIYLASEYCALGSLEKHLRAGSSTFQGNHQYVTGSTTGAEMPISNYVTANLYNQTSYDNIAAHNFVTRAAHRSIEPVTSQGITLEHPITHEDLFRWAYEIACGMEHLASMKVIHSDLATRNVLLTNNKTAKIGDFGLSRQLYYHSDYLKSNSNEELPWRWMSLESLKCLVFSVESDVWTFGVTLWEIFALGQTPYPGVPGWTPNFLFELEVNNYRMDSPTHATAEMFELMKKCWCREPPHRPSFSWLKETILKAGNKLKMTDNKDMLP